MRKIVLALISVLVLLAVAGAIDTAFDRNTSPTEAAPNSQVGVFITETTFLNCQPDANGDLIVTSRSRSSAVVPGTPLGMNCARADSDLRAFGMFQECSLRPGGITCKYICDEFTAC